MRNKVIIGISVSLVLVTAGLLAVAHEVHSWTPEKIGDRVIARLVSRLDLNENQEAELQRIKDEIIEETADARKARKGIRDELIIQFHSDSFDKDKIYKMIDARSEDMKTMKKLFVEKTAEFHTLLTPEQREKFAQGIEKHATRCSYDRENYLKTK